MRRILLLTMFLTPALPFVAHAQFGLPTQGSGKTVNWRQLSPLLSDSLGGWKASAAVEGSTSAAMGFNVSEVSRVYKQGGMTATVKITDSSGNSLLLGAMQLGLGVSEDASDHYQRPVTVGGQPGSEKWSAGNKSGEVTVLAGRFIVAVEANNVPDTKELTGLAGKIDFNKLTALGK